MELFEHLALEKSAIFSEDRKYRYVLTRTWDKTKPKIAFCGLNPSTADEIDEDNTIGRVMNFASSNGFGGMYMLNLFAWVSRYPEELGTCGDPIADNDRYLKEYSTKVERIVFCWGAFKVFGRDNKVIEMFPKAYCLGQNPDGSPKHPLYLKKITKIVPFRTDLIITKKAAPAK